VLAVTAYQLAAKTLGKTGEKEDQANDKLKLVIDKFQIKTKIST